MANVYFTTSGSFKNFKYGDYNQETIVSLKKLQADADQITIDFVGASRVWIFSENDNVYIDGVLASHVSYNIVNKIQSDFFVEAPGSGGGYLGVVASGKYPDGQFGGGANQIQSRVQHFANANMNGFQLKYVNYKGPAEDASGGSLTLFVSIEYPLGTFTRVTFGGSSSAVIASGSDVLSDPVAVSIPDGAMFREWTFATFSGVQALYAVSSNYVDRFRIAASGLTDNTMSGNITGMSDGNFVYRAVAVIGMTNKPSVLILGDSRASGASGNLAYGTNDLGPQAGAIGGTFGYINLSVSGAAMWQFRINSTSKLTSLANYCTHVIIAGHINDINGGDNAAACKANAEGLITKFATGKKAYVCTVEPYTTSSDSWATEANQTILDSTKNTQRVGYNNFIRGGQIIGAVGYFDIAAEVESVAAPGKWLSAASATANAGQYTNDGLHGNRRADLKMSKAINPALFGNV